MKLDEIAPIPTIKPIGSTGTPSTAAKTPAPSAGNIAANTQPTVSNTSSSSQGATSSTAPISSQGIDALAQVIKNAGLNQMQISQLLSKAK